MFHRPNGGGKVELDDEFEYEFVIFYWQELPVARGTSVVRQEKLPQIVLKIQNVNQVGDMLGSIRSFSTHNTQEIDIASEESS